MAGGAAGPPLPTIGLLLFIGVIMLVGILVRNAIILVDYTNQLRRRGMELDGAIVLGGRTRLRPVAMTSLAMIFGMVPLVLSRGEGSEIWNSLGITVIGGLLVSWLVTLVLIPLVYSFMRAGSAFRQSRNNERLSASSAQTGGS